ncbi:CLUMA_CG009634, isoform A [Clunio marinus]|uniref:NADH dehydrogenase [ubiquinone] 1 beta subcomplex subunit 11, mitochondrial n=1 Tax=Clunio marinus TaxID=568069 RepID=A0A1J1IB52_9DIPT|nr:CLUMA_CG009634, isoform A [Clunio marinus]
MKEMNYYEILNVTKEATQDDIKSSYQKLILLHHPDKNQQSREKHEYFLKIDEAYKTLKDPVKRKEYDSILFEAGKSQIIIHDTVDKTNFIYDDENNFFYHVCKCGGWYILDEESSDDEYIKMSLITKLNRLTALRNIVTHTQRNVRFISTSPKKSDTATITTTEKSTETISAKTEKSKDWVYWGFEAENKKDDDDTMHATFFFGISLCIVGTSFILYYQPDFLGRDWTQREAYLELRRREAAGLEPISRDYIDPSLMELPSDEELGDTEIII